MKRATSLVLLAILLATTAGPAWGRPLPQEGGHKTRPYDTGEGECYEAGPYEGNYHQYYLPIVGRRAEMADAGAQARVAAARRKLGQALRGSYQGKINFRQGVVDQAEYDDNGRLIRATANVGGVSGVPISAGVGDGLREGDAIEMIDWGTPAAPDLQFNRMMASAYGDAGTSPAAILATPTGLALTALLRRPTTGGQVAAITATWTALAEMVMGSGGFYEVEYKRNDEVLTGDGHVSRCPHRLGSTLLNGAATYGDATVTVDDTSTFPAAGKFKAAEATVTYTGRTATTFTGCTWTGGSGTYANDTSVTGTTQSILLDHLLTGVDFNARVRAVSATGATSAWSEWASVKTPGNMQLTIEDRFDTYARPDVSDLNNLYVLPLCDFDTDETWVPSGTVTKVTSPLFEGDKAMKFQSAAGPGGGASASRTLALNVSGEGRFTDADYLTLIVATGSSGVYDGHSRIVIDFLMSDMVGVFQYDTGDDAFPTTGTYHMKIKRSDFVDMPFSNWADLMWGRIMWLPGNTAGTDYIVFDNLQTIKADPDDATTYNPTGRMWDFLPLQGSGSEWSVIAGNKTGEPARPYSLAQLYTAPSPANWLLAYHTLSDVYYGTAAAGFYLKGADGEAMLAWNIQDAAVATRTMYAVELDTATDHVRLVKWVAGVRTQIAEADFTAAPDQIVQLGVDFRDFEEDGRIKVYATLTEGDVFLASNMVISETDTDIERGGYVGVGFKECNGRVVDFRAGSPQHAMTAEHAFHAALAERALTADGLDLNGSADALILDADGDTTIRATTDDRIDFELGGVDLINMTSGGLTLPAGATVSEFSIDGSLAGNSDTAAPTEKAVKTYVDGRVVWCHPPLTSTSFDGDAVGASTAIDLSAAFGLPAGIKAIYATLEIKDETAQVFVGIGPDDGHYQSIPVRTQVANGYIIGAGWAPCAAGDVYLYLSGEIDYCSILVWGYAV